MTKHSEKTALVTVIVKPRSARCEVKVEGGAFVVRVTAPPVEGQANDMCLALVADWLGVPKSRLTILSGAHRRQKTIGVAGLDQAEINARLSDPPRR
jgi:hypothetical protein